MKKFTLLFALVVMLGACNQSKKQNAENSDTSKTEEVVAATIEAMLANPADYVEKEVVLTGMVTHVCKHGGQKCFVLAEDGETQIRINVGSEIDEFDTALEGSTVEFKGLFKVLDAVETTELEEDHESKEHHENEMAHTEAEKASYFVEAVSYTEITE
jgi:hypothetical protein